MKRAVFGDATDRQSYRQLVREYCDEHPGLTTEQYAEAIYRAHPLTETQEYAYVLRGLKGLIRSVLREKDEEGLPNYGRRRQTAFEGFEEHADREGSEGSTLYVWIPRRRWTFEDYDQNCNEYWHQGDMNYSIADQLATECTGRFGHRPERRAMTDGDATEDE